MELFVFMRMGGKREDIDVRLLEETTNLAVRLTSFDAVRQNASSIATARSSSP